jgi:hypothetical protein
VLSTLTRRTVRLAAAGAAALGLAVIPALPSQAVILPEVDRPKITETGYDFGTNWDSFGAPLNGGHLSWDLTNGVTTPILTGNLYLKNASGNCAKLKVEYLDEDSDVVETDYSPELCANNDRMTSRAITMDDVGFVGLTHARIKLISTPNNGSWYLQGEQTWSVY